MFAYEYKCTEYLARGSRISSYENPNHSSVTNDYADPADLSERCLLTGVEGKKLRKKKMNIQCEENKHKNSLRKLHSKIRYIFKLPNLKSLSKPRYCWII